MYKIRNSKIYKWFYNQLNYRPYKRYFGYKNNTKDLRKLSNRVLVIDVNRNPYNRYLFNLCFFFIKEDFSILIKNSLNLHKDLYSDKYSMYIYNLPNTHFVHDIQFITANLCLNNNNLNKDYFNNYSGNNWYKIPMSMHPDTYLFLDRSKSSITISKERVNSIFFTGNFNRKSYSKISKDNKFKIINRFKFIQKVITHKNLTTMQYGKKRTYTSGVIVYNNSAHNWIKKKDYLEELYRFKFFLCLPGVAMPFSHNIIEAMYCGCIPILDMTYANLFNPPLEHKVNALIFKDFKEFVNIFEKIKTHQFSESETETISQNVLNYYTNFLSIKVVTSKMKKYYKNDGLFVLLASQNSVKLL